ncbi:hypothetical protein [Opitutus sp. GAS368]|uniref:hypothetical protein n=1 Tax=Opitutus sp. GAS368 TaxID=1882749 RepID=UPI00087AE3B0|nr:hypothetical protein [Opitutus sp. GAS368]SDS37952.1 hypothetical protein SAMN05444173_2724 [Opitutus sp. GAS368]
MIDLPNKEPNEFQKKINVLRADIKTRLRICGYKILIKQSSDTQRESDWMLLVTGGTLALLASHLRDLMELYTVSEIQISLGALLISGLCGFIANSFWSAIKVHISKDSEFADDIEGPMKKVLEEVKKIAIEAAEAGTKVEWNVDVEEVEWAIHRHLPGYTKYHKDIETKLQENPFARWDKAIKQTKTHRRLVGIQFGLVFAALASLLMNLGTVAPSKASPLGNSTSQLTAPAGHK